MLRPFLACALFLGLITPVIATPMKIFITRHGNKVEKGFCLSLQGMERAAAFTYYFPYTDAYLHPPISHIFAAYHGGDKPYIRPKQTCQPLADYLRIPLNIQFKPDQIKEVTQEILTNPKYDNAAVLLCWEHHHIPDLVEALGGGKVESWDGDIFDQVYVLTFEGKDKPHVEKILQKLLYGDRSSFAEKPTPLPEVAIPCFQNFGSVVKQGGQMIP